MKIERMDEGVFVCSKGNVMIDDRSDLQDYYFLILVGDGKMFGYRKNENSIFRCNDSRYGLYDTRFSYKWHYKTDGERE